MFLLLVFAGCSEEKEPECDVQPEPFRFKITDQSGSNRLTDANRPDNTRIYYIKYDTDATLELEFKGSGEETYGISPVLPYISVFEKVVTYYLERGNVIDTLSVSVSERKPGDQCAGYVYNSVSLNGVQAVYDDKAAPPVYVLKE